MRMSGLITVFSSDSDPMVGPRTGAARQGGKAPANPMVHAAGVADGQRYGGKLSVKWNGSREG